MAIFKYFNDERFARGLVQRGRLLFRPLSYFRRIEADEVRGDPNDGNLRFQPEPSLDLTKSDGTTVSLSGWRFEASPKHDEVFVHCASRQLSQELVGKFGRFCVEIGSVDALVDRVRARRSQSSKLDYDVIYHGMVEYRPLDTPPGVDWALPEKLVSIKPTDFAYQDEYRIALGTRGAFDVENVELRLKSSKAMSETIVSNNRSFQLELGNLEDIATLHSL